MDLGRFDVKAAASEGADLHIKHPMTGEPLFDDGEPVVVRVIGRDSPVVREKMAQLDKRKAGGEVLSKDDEGIELFCAVVVGWSHIELDGEVLECNRDSIRRLMTDPRTEWIGEQVGPFALNRRNFAKNLPTG